MTERTPMRSVMTHPSRRSDGIMTKKKLSRDIFDSFFFVVWGMGFGLFGGKFSFLYNIWVFGGFKGYFNNSLGVGVNGKMSYHSIKI